MRGFDDLEFSGGILVGSWDRVKREKRRVAVFTSIYNNPLFGYLSPLQYTCRTL